MFGDIITLFTFAEYLNKNELIILKQMKTYRNISEISTSTSSRNGNGIFCSTGRNNADTGSGFKDTNK
jgi:hypothetical protein